jgi:LysM repeat protein
MNNPSPLIPQGATPPRGKSNLYFKVLMILTVHVVVISGMLLQGCKDTSKETAKTDTNSIVPPTDTTAMTTTTPNTTSAVTTPIVDVPPTVNPNISNAYVGATPTAAQLPVPAPTSTSTTAMIPPAKATDLNPPAATGEGKDYVVAHGDTLAVIAHKNGISLKALEDANPNVNPKRLQVGQKLQIPAGTSSVAANTTSGATPTASGDATPSEGSSYVVKSGDTLSKIAKAHGTSFKKIMAMNDLKTTSIRVGQKLKMPAPKAAAEPAPTVTPMSTPSAPAAASAPSTPPAMRVTPTTTSPVAAN